MRLRTGVVRLRTMSDVDLDTLRTVGHVGKTRGKARIRKLTDGGKVRAIEVDHADGRQSAVVRPDTVRQSVSVSEVT